ncbi:phosphatidate cytidylyltransferase, putative [Plasmodium malariae]|uniref:dolichol kinase n=1 Tax=Plasmodium malariae TaxID=5858 RepID=A0A1D3JKL8_PLAMA|nr:phosphatidate cytidylyltransferase, putative [Plasmodium malariae]SBT87096.1 phosphatidate cytidylyltransferase, putative [Plasmodium malariae]
MINCTLIILMTVTEVKKRIFLSRSCTYKWILLTILCNALIVVCLHRKAKEEGKWGGEKATKNVENNAEKKVEIDEGKEKNKRLYLSSFTTIGAYYQNEKSAHLSNKNNANYLINLYKEGDINIYHLFFYTYFNNIFFFFFLPFFSSLLIFKYYILKTAKLSVVLVNTFVLSSVLLRHVRVSLSLYFVCHSFFFLLILSEMKISGNELTCFFCFIVNFVFYHMLSISLFHLTNKVFSFLEGLIISAIGTLALDCSFYSFVYSYLNHQIVPTVLFRFFSKATISLVAYGMCCAYCLQNAAKNRGKIMIASMALLLYNLFNFISSEHDSRSIKDTNVLHILISMVWRENNYILILLWFIITTFYLMYIINMSRRNKNLSYLRKHYHFLLFVNVKLSFLKGQIDLLIVALSFIFLIFIFVEMVRKICEVFFPSLNAINKFIARFIDERDSKGIVVTHIYLLAGVYIPIITDALFSNKNYVHKKKQIMYFFREANFLLYSSGLNTICIGDSLAAIGGFLFPTPKMKNTNNKSYAGFLFFFFTTFLSFLLSSYFLQQTVSWANLNIFFMVSLFGALFEAYLLDIDNLILPLFAFCVYLSFEK